MVRIGFYWVSLLVLAVVLGLAWLAPPVLYALIVVIPLIGIGIYDIYSRHNVLCNYPVIGHLRYFFEFVRPELRQYLFESNSSGRPFNREQRTLINERADGKADTSPFGTLRDVGGEGYNFALHSMGPQAVADDAARVRIGGPACRQPYSSSRLNISAMSFGSLSSHAILALNKGAKLGGFAHDTGEGGLTRYHLEHGGDLIWEIGSGYFGCRTSEGRFDDEDFRRKAGGDTVKMIELKISQGAKPGHGGFLPAGKVNQEIAEAREVEAGQDCQSPASHPEFSTPEGMLHFIARLRELADGKPVGFKLCVGERSEFMGVVKAMLETGILPDFITVDGAEGGTGAAPIEFSDRLGLTINEALIFVNNCLVGAGLRDDIRIIASGKVAMGFDMVVKTALGADVCNAARPMLFALGCIQALRCHTNTCPTGVTTQNPRRIRALDVELKHVRVRNLHQGMIKSFLDLTGAMGLNHPRQLSMRRIYHRLEDGPERAYADIYPTLAARALLEEKAPADYSGWWNAASAAHF